MQSLASTPSRSKPSLEELLAGIDWERQNARVDTYEAEIEKDRHEQRVRSGRIPVVLRCAAVCDCPELDGVDITANLLFHGHQGAGKSYAACAVAIERAKSVTVRYASFGEILDAVFGGEGMAAYRNCALLVIDDLGKTAQTNATVERLRDLLEWRLVNGKQTIITTSYDGRGLVSVIAAGSDAEHAKDVASRLREFTAIEFGGSDRRGR